MHNCVTSHLWLKSALHASSHPCMCTCVLRLGCFLLACPVLYFVPPFSFQPFLMFTSEFNERSRSNPLCDFRLGTVATSDHETPLTVLEAEAQVGKWLDCSARITSKELAPILSVKKWHPPECLFCKSDLFCKSENGCKFGERCSSAHRQVDEQLRAKVLQRMVTKVQWLC